MTICKHFTSKLEEIRLVQSKTFQFSIENLPFSQIVHGFFFLRKADVLLQNDMY